MELQCFDLYKIKGCKMLKKIYFTLFSLTIGLGVYVNSYAESAVVEDVLEEDIIKSADEVSADALNDYDVEGSLFQKIADLEQEKLVMQLETERIKMGLELDRLNREKMKMQKELNNINAPVSQRSTTDMEMVKAEIEAQTAQLKKQIEALQKKQEEQQTEVIVERYEDVEEEPKVSRVTSKYKLINVIGIGNQLQATIEDITTGQNKRIAVGKKLDGYTVKSISLNDGIVLEKNGLSESLNVGR